MVHPMIQSASLSNTINDTLMYHVRFRHDMIELSEKDDICSTVSEVVYRARHFDTGTETRVKASMVEVEFKLLDAVEATITAATGGGGDSDTWAARSYAP